MFRKQAVHMTAPKRRHHPTKPLQSGHRPHMTTGVVDAAPGQYPERMSLVASRECGNCTVCCKILPIRAAGLRKTSHELCVHCHEHDGCTIYAARPQVCRDYYCGWRMLPGLPGNWRPDLSGIFVDRVRFNQEAQDEIPAEYRRDFMLQLLLLKPDSIEDPLLPEVAGAFIDVKIPVFLGVCGPPGFQNALVFINAFAKAAVARRDREAVLAVLRKAAAIAGAHPFEPLPE
jgi:hypothetical protein